MFNSTNNATVIDMTAILFNTVMTNVQKIGEDSFIASIPMALLDYDSAYQRQANPNRIKKLSDGWKKGLCGMPQVSPHTEENKFYVYNGAHRIRVLADQGKDSVVCEVNMDFIDMSPEERQKAEAELFAAQYDCVDRLTSVQKHRVNVLLGVPANVYVHNLCLKYNVHDGTDELEEQRTGARSKAANTLTGLWAAIAIAQKKRNHLDDVFKTICSCGWNEGYDGFKACVIQALETVFVNHPDRKHEIMKAMHDWIRRNGDDKPGIPEKVIEAGATEKYNGWSTKSAQMALYIEDYLHTAIDLPYTYTGRTELNLVKGA